MSKRRREISWTCKKFMTHFWDTEILSHISVCSHVCSFSLLSASWYYQNAYDIFVELRTQVFPQHKQMFICMSQHPLTLNALQGSIFSPYCKGFTWINLNQKDLPKEKHICFTISSTQGVLPVLQKPRGRLGRGTDQTRLPAGSRNQWRFKACLFI